jgi:two-component system, cell cycle sensor histidine kinase and response regulator CckA
MNKSLDSTGKEPGGHDINAADLAASGEHLEKFIEFSPLPVYVLNDDFEILLANSAACEYLNSSAAELPGKKLGEIVRPEELERLKRLIAAPNERPAPHGEWELRRKDGSWVWADLSLRVLPSGTWLIFASDLDDRKRREIELIEFEAQRFQMQKFEALGRLAGGIAHDFNNFLAVVLLQIDMLNLQLPADSPVRHRVNEIKEVSKNAAGIVRQLMAFGRRQPMNPAPVVLNQVIRNLSPVLTKLVGDGIRLDLNLGSELGVCFVDQGQIGQVLTNLTVNAKDAMPEGGEIRISTRNIVLDKREIQKSQSPGAYIEIAFTDNGIGMDQATKDHIFEPFFSTRETDKGAGLGLASVYGIVKQSKGYIWAESTPGHGTTFIIQFPRIDQHEPSAEEAEPDDSMPEGDETVLLVDDDDAVRRLSAGILRMSGYEVLEAGSGHEAIEAAKRTPGTIHLLVTDLYMPQMDGRKVARELKILHPETAVLFMSGENIESGPGGETKHFLGKPFTPAKLAKKVREVLDSNK